jgi:hypothetical protein
MGNMNIAELMANEGMSYEEANLEMHRRTFGRDVKFDRNGKPIETGIGSANHKTVQSEAALRAAEQRGKS